MKIFSSSYTFFVVLFALSSCSSEPVKVEFAEMMNNNTAGRFEVDNNMEEDIMKISFEVIFVDGFGEELVVDTVSYDQTTDSDGNSKPFVEANSSTFFVWQAPEKAISGRARVLSYD